MKKTIFKGFHRPIGIPAFLCPIGHLRKGASLDLHRKVIFQDNCAYDLHNVDQYDWNKIYGVCFGILGIHKNSVRFGWRYNTNTQLIEICVIVYRPNRDPQRYQVAEIPFNKEVLLEINMQRMDNDIDVFFRVEGMHVGGVTLAPDSFFYYGCGFYFGGNCRAPHKMSIKIN